MSELKCKVNGETYLIKPRNTRDGKKMCGGRWCDYCKCHLRTSSWCKQKGELHAKGSDWQTLNPCTEPCKIIKDKFAHFCKLEECYFVKEKREKTND